MLSTKGRVLKSAPCCPSSARSAGESRRGHLQNRTEADIMTFSGQICQQRDEVVPAVITTRDSG